MQYIITNSFGDQLGGISTNESEIKRMAQRTANDLGESVWYTALAEDFDAVEVEPEADNGPLIELGQLGSHMWFRCQSCGLDQCAIEIPDKEQEDNAREPGEIPENVPATRR